MNAVRFRRIRDDRGFTLVEGLVALVISVIISTAFAQSLIVSFRSAREARIQEQATLLSVEGVELARDLTWDEIAMTSTEVGDTRIAGGKLLASAVDLPADEDLAIDAVNGLIDPTRVESLDDASFVIAQYVTDVSPGLRRVVIVVEWFSGANLREHHTSTLIAEVRDGP